MHEKVVLSPAPSPASSPTKPPQHFPRCHQGFQSHTVHTCSPHLHSGQCYLPRRNPGRSLSGHFHPSHGGFSSVGARSPQPCSLSGVGAAPKPPGLGTAQPNTREWVRDLLLPGVLGSCCGRGAGGHSEDAQRIFGYSRLLAVPGSTPCPRSRDPTQPGFSWGGQECCDPPSDCSSQPKKMLFSADSHQPLSPRPALHGARPQWATVAIQPLGVTCPLSPGGCRCHSGGPKT